MLRRIVAAQHVTDGESHYSRLALIHDAASEVEPVNLYRGNFWITDLDGTVDGTLYACDADGYVHSNVSGKWSKKKVADKGLRAIRVLEDGSIVTAGTDGFVYLRKGKTWTKLDHNFGQWINVIDGSSATDFAVAGDQGTFAMRQGAGWKLCALPTNLTVNAVLRGSSGDYLAGGVNDTAGGGIMILGNGSKQVPTENPVYALAQYRREVYAVCGSAGVCAWVDGAMVERRKKFFYTQLRTAGDFLAVAGESIVIRHNGLDQWAGKKFDAAP